MALTACNQTARQSAPSDTQDSLSVVQDTLSACEEIETAPEDMWTDEYITNWVKSVYEKVNEVWSRQEVHQEELDTAFFAKSYLDLKQRVFKAQEGKDFDHLCFVEYMPFSQGLRVPIKVSNIRPLILTGNIAEVTFTISDSDGADAHLWWHLDFANGQWRIDDYKNDPEAELTEMERMDAYLQPETDLQNDLNQYAE